VAPALKAVVLTPPWPTVLQGGSQQLAATGIYTDDTSAPLSGLTWSSSDTTVATVADGLVTGAADKPGSVTITATDTASQLGAQVTFGVMVTSAPQLTAVPTFGGPAQATGTMPVTLEFTSNVTSLSIYLYDKGPNNSYGYQSASVDPGTTTKQIDIPTS